MKHVNKFLRGKKTKESQVESPVEPTTLGEAKPESRQIESPMEPMMLGKVKPKSRQAKSPVRPRALRGSKNSGRMRAKLGSIEKSETDYNIPIDYIRLNSVDLKEGETLNALKTLKRDGIIKKLESIKANIEPSEENRVLYRFFEEKEGLLSLAQKMQTQPDVVPDNVLSALKQDHMHANQKSITVKNGENSKTYYSPLISTTESLQSFVNNSFSKLGDAALRLNVFSMSPFIGVFAVPNKLCIHPDTNKFVDTNRALLEKEVCFDASEKKLDGFLKRQVENPFKGNVDISLQKLAISKGIPTNDLLYKEAVKVDSSIQKIFADIGDKALTKQNIKELGGLLDQKSALITELVKIQAPIPEPKKYEIKDDQLVSQIPEKLQQSAREIAESIPRVSTHTSTSRKHTGKPFQGNAPDL